MTKSTYISILDLIRANPKINFRELLIKSDLSPEEIWACLKILREQKVVETTKISNKKGYGYKLQLKYLEGNRQQYLI